MLIFREILYYFNAGKSGLNNSIEHLIKTKRIKFLLLFCLSILFGHCVFGQTQTYIDQFSSVSYNNNNGTHNFSNNWTEFNDNGSPNNGYVRITSGRLLFRHLYSEGIYRNLSIPANANAIFTCSFTSNTLETGEILDVQLWNTSMSDWETIASIDNSPSSGTISYTLKTNHKSANSGVRFLKGGGNWSSNNDNVYIDNIKFEVTLSPPSITATGNQDFCLSLGNSISIAESVTITGSGTGTSEVYVQISSGYVNGEDELTLTGTHSNITTSWNAVEGKLTLNGTPTALYSEFADAIEAIEYSNSNLSATGNRDFAITVGNASYLPSSGHYYEYVPSPLITWTQARDAAALRTYFGLKGYLATLTSADEGTFAGTQSIGVGWIGGSDVHTENVWRWVTGPEGLENGGLGRQFWQGRGSGSGGTTTGPDNYAFWNPPNEPNQAGSGEDYAHITHANVGPAGSWNDLPNVTSTSGNYMSQGYVVEYGGMPSDPTLSISDATKINIINSPDAGSNGSIDNCASNVLTEADLFAALTGSPDVGGTWSPAISAGSRDYTYTVNATSPCVGVATAIVSVTEFVTPTITGTTPDSNCGTGSVTLNASTNVGVIKWYSAASGGSLLHTGASFNISGLSSTTSYYVESENGICNSNRVEVVATIHPLVAVSVVASNPEVCEGETVTLSGSATPPSGTYSYAWREQGNTTILATTKDYSFVTVGDPNSNIVKIYEFIATDINTFCVSLASSVDVKIETLPSVTLTSVNPVCPTLNNGSISFNFGDHTNRSHIEFSKTGISGPYTTVTDNSSSFSFANLTAGNYEVWVRWGNNECPVDLGTVNLILDNIPDPIGIFFE